LAERSTRLGQAQCVGSDDMSTGGAPRRSRTAILNSRSGMVVSGLVGRQVRNADAPGPDAESRRRRAAGVLCWYSLACTSRLKGSLSFF